MQADAPPPLPTGTHAQFRDPVTPWTIERAVVRQQFPSLLEALTLDQANVSLSFLAPPSTPLVHADSGGNNTNTTEGGPIWFSVIGALQQCVGSAALYASLDLRWVASREVTIREVTTGEVTITRGDE